jgi:OOP family OmpA-OmpF porin
MKKSIPIMVASMLLVSLWAIASVQAIEIITRDMVEKETITETDLIRTADNFIILFDTSSSTNEMVPGKSISKIQAAKGLLKSAMPGCPIWAFRPACTSTPTMKPWWGHSRKSTACKPTIATGLPPQSISCLNKVEGGTTLNAGLSPLRKVVAGLSGKTAIIMFTDGKTTRIRGTKKPLQIAQEIARDSDVCFYLVSSATEEMNAQMLESVTQVNSCSRVIPIAAFMDNPQYLSGALFTVKTSSYTRLKPMTQTVGVFVDDILFDYDSSVLRSEYNGKLDELGDYLVKNPDAFLVVGGFADSRGDDEYNMWLSQRRALSVKNYLLSTYTIDWDRIVLQWFGEQNPAADNATEEGRQLNRRVELAVGM